MANICLLTRRAVLAFRMDWFITHPLNQAVPVTDSHSVTKHRFRARRIVEAHVQYMSPVCAGLNDALRTASSRGISGSSINDMRRDYRNKCQDNESDAHERLSKAGGEKKLEKLETQKAEKVDSERASIRAQQCGESKRILTTKRARTDLTNGEKSDLQRFEDNYRSRCG